MTFDEALKEIESPEFSARLNLASDFKGFFHAVELEKAIGIALSHLCLLSNMTKLLRRISELTRQNVDLRYENPWDNTLTVYLWILNVRDVNIAKIAAEKVAETPQCWWATKYAKHLLLDKGLVSMTANKLVFDLLMPTQTRSALTSSRSVESFFITTFADMCDTEILEIITAKVRGSKEMSLKTWLPTPSLKKYSHASHNTPAATKVA